MVRPGDTLRTNCTYNTGTARVSWGLSSSDEMCIDYVRYLPTAPHIVQPPKCARQSRAASHLLNQTTTTTTTTRAPAPSQMMYYPRQAILDSEAGGCGLNHGGRLLQPSTAMVTPADRHGFGDQAGLTSLATTTAPAPAPSLSQPPGGSHTNTMSVVAAAVAVVAAAAIALGCYVKREKIKPVFCGSTGPVYSDLGVEMGEIGDADSDVDDGDAILN